MNVGGPIRLAELTRALAFHGLTEDDCRIWFGVCIATLERIEAGEVEPSDELEQRINRFLNAVGGGFLPLPSPTPSSPPYSGEPTGGATEEPLGRAASFGSERSFEGSPIHANRGEQ